MEKRKVLHRVAFPHCANDLVVPPIPTIQKEYQTEEYSEDGRLLKRVVVKSVDMAERVKGVKVNDFALENQIAIGSTGLANYISLHDSRIDGVLDKLDAASQTPVAPSSSSNEPNSSSE